MNIRFKKMNMFTSIINLSNIIAFAVGILTGIAIFFLIFVIIITKGKKESKRIYKPTMEKLSDDKVNDLILKKQNDFVHEVDENDADFLKTTLSMTLDLLHEISSYYFPESSSPEYELTIEEAGNLIHYIVDSILSWTDKKVFAAFNLKELKLSTIYQMIDKYNKAKKNKIVKAVASDNTKETYGVLRQIANVVNPVYWIKKVAVNLSIHLALKKLCKAELYLAGTEFNKVYSKKLFDDDTSSNDEVIKGKIEEIFNDERTD